MEIIYNWLLHNTGNEGNHFTILNAQRQAEDGKAADIEVMARTKGFEIINLVIKAGLPTERPIDLPNRTLKENHFFADDNQVVAYLTEGRTANAESAQQGVSVYIFMPTPDSSELTFPPQ